MKVLHITERLMEKMIKEAVNLGRDHEYAFQRQGGSPLVVYPTFEELAKKAGGLQRSRRKTYEDS